jgi:hypothetical protein
VQRIRAQMYILSSQSSVVAGIGAFQWRFSHTFWRSLVLNPISGTWYLYAAGLAPFRIFRLLRQFDKKNYLVLWPLIETPRLLVPMYGNNGGVPPYNTQYPHGPYYSVPLPDHEPQLNVGIPGAQRMAV